METKQEKKTDATSIADEQSDLIVVELPYNRKLVFELSEGFQFLQLMAQAREIEADYGKPKKLKTTKENMTITFMSKQELKELIFNSILEPGEKP